MSQQQFDFERFVSAQRPVYERVIEELKSGRKRSHWMWFVFPQLKGLGGSPMAVRFALASLEEAKAYLQHDLLGPRLRECTELVNGIAGRSALEIFGSPDDLKFRSCMTLFSLARPTGTHFDEAITRFYDGELDAATLNRL